MLTDIAPEAFSPQWRLSEIELVNWGNFDGHHRIPIVTSRSDESSSVVMLTGISGAGKSTLFDAFTELMMPSNRRFKFNAASNKGQRARDAGERTVQTYVRGKYATAEGSDDTERDECLRPDDRPTWSAIEFTYSSSSGGSFSAARVFYLKPRMSDSQMAMFCLTSAERLDLALLNGFLGEPFSAGVMRRAFPKAVLHESVTRFMDSVFSGLSIGRGGDGLNAIELLYRIQAGFPVDNVDVLFKGLVLDEPRTYDLAREALRIYDSNEQAYRDFDEARRKRAELTPIVDLHARREEARNDLTLLGRLAADTDEGIFALWSAELQGNLLQEAIVEDEAICDKCESEVAEREREITALEAEAARLEAEIAEGGGGRLSALESDIERARELLPRRRDAARILKARLDAVGVDMPMSEESYAAMLESLWEQVQSYVSKADQLREENEQTAISLAEAKKRLTNLGDQLDFYERNRVRITPPMATARERMAQAAGIDEADLPFAAELMDVASDEEQWRDAVNIALHGLASTVLVRQEDFERLSAAVDPVDIGMRVSFRSVDISRTYDHAVRAGHVSSKLVYDEDSPFAGWLQAQVGRERSDYECVSDALQLKGGVRRITKSGQTREGDRGAHGHGRDFSIIGLSNAPVIEALHREIAETKARRDELEGEYRASNAKLNNFERMRDMADDLSARSYEEYDVAGLECRMADWEAEYDELRNSDALKRLVERREIVRQQQRESVSGQALARQAHERASQRLVSHRELAADSARRAGALRQAGVAVDAEAAERLAGIFDNASDMVAPEERADRFDSLVGKVRRTVSDVRRRHGRTIEECDAQLRVIFENYHKSWLHGDTNIGTHPVDSYSDYAEILAELDAEKLDESQDAWTLRMARLVAAALVPLHDAYATEVRAIKERIEPINSIMKGFSFGVDDGRLVVVVDDADVRSIVDFRRRIGRLSGYATLSDASQAGNLDAVHDELSRLMEEVRGELDATHSVLDTRRLVRIKIYAYWPGEPERQRVVFNRLGEQSGGENQELIAFILGAALLYYLGDNGENLPSYATVLLDEAFIKSDERVTRRAIKALNGLGFQVILAVPTSKIEAVNVVADEYITVYKDREHRANALVEMREQ